MKERLKYDAEKLGYINIFKYGPPPDEAWETPEAREPEVTEDQDEAPDM